MKMRNVIKPGRSYEQLVAAVALLDFSDEPALGPACVSVYDEFGGRQNGLAGLLCGELEELAALDRRIRKLRDRIQLQSPSDGDYETGKTLLKREIERRKVVAARAESNRVRFLEAKNVACKAWVKWAQGCAARCEERLTEIGKIGGTRADAIARTLMHVATHFRETADELVLIESRLKKDILDSFESGNKRNRRRQVSPCDSFLQTACRICDEHGKFLKWAMREHANLCREYSVNYCRKL